MPGFNHVALARHAHALLLALQQVQGRAPPGGRPVPPLLHEHVESLTAALEKLGEQLTFLVGGDPLLANAQTDGAVREGDLNNLVKWWQDGRIAQLLARVLGLAVRDLAALYCKAPGGPAAASSASPSRAVSRAASVRSYAGDWADTDAARALKAQAAYESFLSSGKAQQCAASVVVLHGVLRVVVAAVQLLRTRPASSLFPPPPLPPPPEPEEGDEAAGERDQGQAQPTQTQPLSPGQGKSGGGKGGGKAKSPAQGKPASPGPTGKAPGKPQQEQVHAAHRDQAGGDGDKSDGAPAVPTAAELDLLNATANRTSATPTLPPAPGAKPVQATRRKPRAAAAGAKAGGGEGSGDEESGPPPRPEEGRYAKLVARHKNAERLFLGWSGLQDAVLDLLCNSPLLVNLTELLRHAGPLLALPAVGAPQPGGAAGVPAAPRVAALYRQAWSVVPLVAALAHSCAAAAAVSLPPPAAAAGAMAPAAVVDARSAAVLLSALGGSGVMPQCCDSVLSVSRAGLSTQAAAKQSIAAAAQQLLAAGVRLCGVVDAAGGAQALQQLEQQQKQQQQQSAQVEANGAVAAPVAAASQEPQGSAAVDSEAAEAPTTELAAEVGTSSGDAGPSGSAAHTASGAAPASASGEAVADAAPASATGTTSGEPAEGMETSVSGEAATVAATEGPAASQSGEGAPASAPEASEAAAPPAPPPPPPAEAPPPPVLGLTVAAALLKEPAVQYFIAERQASAVAQAYGEIVAAAGGPGGGGITPAALAAALKSSWTVASEVGGGGAGPASPGAGGQQSAQQAAQASGAVSAVEVLDAARGCGLDLLPVPVLPWAVPVEAATAAVDGAAAGAAAASGRTAAQTIAAATASLRVASAGPGSAGGLGAMAAARRRREGPGSAPSSAHGSHSASPLPSPGGAGTAAIGGAGDGATKLPPLRAPIKVVDSEGRRRELARAAKAAELADKEAQLVALVRATALGWQALLSSSGGSTGAARSKGDAAGEVVEQAGEGEGEGDGEDGAADDGRPCTPAGHVPSASRAVVQLVSAAAVCRAVSSGGGNPAAAAAAATTSSSLETPEEAVAALLAALVGNAAAAEALCGPAERGALHEQSAALLRSVLATAQELLARSQSPDVSTPLVAVAEACLTWVAEAEALREAEQAALDQQLEELHMAAAEAELAAAEQGYEEEGQDAEEEAEGEEGADGRSKEERRAAALHAAAAAREGMARLAAAARDAGRLAAGVALCEGCVRFLVAHHQHMVGMLVRAGLLRPGLKLREEHTRHAQLLQRTLASLAGLAGRTAAAVADAQHLPMAMAAHARSSASGDGAASGGPDPGVARAHALTATAITAAYAPVSRALHSALLSVRKCLAVAASQLSLGGGGGSGGGAAAAPAMALEVVPEVAAALCAFPGALAAVLLPAHELAAMRESVNGEADGKDPASAEEQEDEYEDDAEEEEDAEDDDEPEAQEDVEEEGEEEYAEEAREAADAEEVAEAEEGEGLYPWGLEPIVEASERSLASSSVRSPSQTAMQRHSNTNGHHSQPRRPGGDTIDEEVEEVEDGVESEPVSPPGGFNPGGPSMFSDAYGNGGAAGTAPASTAPAANGAAARNPAKAKAGARSPKKSVSQRQRAQMDKAAAKAKAKEEARVARVLEKQRKRAAARAAKVQKVSKTVPPLARAVASASLHMAVPSAWRVYVLMLLQMARAEQEAAAARRAAEDAAPAPAPPADAPAASEAAAAPSPPDANAAANASSGSASGDAGSSKSALTAVQRGALSRATTGLWDLLHVLLTITRSGLGSWPAAAFALPAPHEAELRAAVAALSRTQQLQQVPPEQQQPEKSAEGAGVVADAAGGAVGAGEGGQNEAPAAPGGEGQDGSAADPVDQAEAAEAAELAAAEAAAAAAQAEADAAAADAAAAAAAADEEHRHPPLARSVPEWREAVMLVEQVFSMAAAWAELQAAEGSFLTLHAAGTLSGGAAGPDGGAISAQPSTRMGPFGPGPAMPMPSVDGDFGAGEAAEPSAAELLRSFLKSDGRGIGSKSFRLRSRAASAAAAPPAPSGPPVLILSAAEAERIMAGAPPRAGGGGAAGPGPAPQPAMAGGCGYPGCTSLVGANEAAIGRNVVCACERVAYCSTACQVADWNERHFGQCKLRRRLGQTAAAAAGTQVATGPGTGGTMAGTVLTAQSSVVSGRTSPPLVAAPGASVGSGVDLVSIRPPRGGAVGRRS